MYKRLKYLLQCCIILAINYSYSYNEPINIGIIISCRTNLFNFVCISKWNMSINTTCYIVICYR